MKKLLQLILMSVVLVSICGCATTDRKKYETRLRPPDEFNPVWMRYQELPGEKVMVIAVDMDGAWAFGYDHGLSSLAEAAESATIKCDKTRKQHKVFTKPKLFAVNDKIVYYDEQFK